VYVLLEEKFTAEDAEMRREFSEAFRVPVLTLRFSAPSAVEKEL
jgi:hypothetical protein